jgi:endo-1,4-beta-mannosidase
LSGNGTAESGNFRLGVNYWPARTAMYWWDDVQAPEVDRDMARIAELGLQEARIFLLWEAFQPRAEVVSDQALGSLATILQAAERHDVGLVLSLFCGHMSGVNWLPGWAVDRSLSPTIRTFSGGRVVPGGAGDLYADPELLDAQLFLARRLASTFAGHRALARWDLGNEFSNLRWPAHPDEIARWSSLLTEALQPAGIEVSGGLHAQDLEQDRGIRISSIAAPWREVVMHGYPIYSDSAAAPDDPDWVPFLSATAARFAAKRVNAEEFGLPDHELGETPVARYADAVLDRLWRIGAVGASWWCFTDYAVELGRLPPFDLAPHELHFGLFRADGGAKPVADTWRRFGRRAAREMPQIEGPDEVTWYAGLPARLERAYAEWRERWSAPGR